MEIAEELIEVAARSDAEFDGRPWLSMGKADRDRYLARSRLAITAVAPLIAAQEREACARMAGEMAERYKGLSGTIRAYTGNLEDRIRARGAAGREEG